MELRMSRKERDRLKGMAAVAEGRLKQTEAAARVRLSGHRPGSGPVRGNGKDLTTLGCRVRVSGSLEGFVCALSG